MHQAASLGAAGGAQFILSQKDIDFYFPKRPVSFEQMDAERQLQTVINDFRALVDNILQADETASEKARLLGDIATTLQARLGTGSKAIETGFGLMARLAPWFGATKAPTPLTQAIEETVRGLISSGVKPSTIRAALGAQRQLPLNSEWAKQQRAAEKAVPDHLRWYAEQMRGEPSSVRPKQAPSESEIESFENRLAAAVLGMTKGLPQPAVPEHLRWYAEQMRGAQL